MEGIGREVFFVSLFLTLKESPYEIQEIDVS